MDAQYYVHEQERLSEAMNSRENLDAAVKDILATLRKHCLLGMTGASYDVFKFALETHHLSQFDLPER